MVRWVHSVWVVGFGVCGTTVAAASSCAPGSVEAWTPPGNLAHVYVESFNGCDVATTVYAPSGHRHVVACTPNGCSIAGAESEGVFGDFWSQQPVLSDDGEHLVFVGAVAGGPSEAPRAGEVAVCGRAGTGFDCSLRHPLDGVRAVRGLDRTGRYALLDVGGFVIWPTDGAASPKSLGLHKLAPISLAADGLSAVASGDLDPTRPELVRGLFRIDIDGDGDGDPMTGGTHITHFGMGQLVDASPSLDHLLVLSDVDPLHPERRHSEGHGPWVVQPSSDTTVPLHAPEVDGVQDGSISDDGRFVVFQSTYRAPHCTVVEVSSRRTVRFGEAEPGLEPHSGCKQPVLSGNGDRIAFTTEGPAVGGAPSARVFVLPNPLWTAP